MSSSQVSWHSSGVSLVQLQLLIIFLLVQPLWGVGFMLVTISPAPSTVISLYSRLSFSVFTKESPFHYMFSLFNSTDNCYSLLSWLWLLSCKKAEKKITRIRCFSNIWKLGWENGILIETKKKELKFGVEHLPGRTSQQALDIEQPHTDAGTHFNRFMLLS